MRKTEVGMRKSECGKWNLEGGILKHGAKSMAHGVEQRAVLRFRVSGVRGRCQKTDDRVDRGRK